MNKIVILVCLILFSYEGKSQSIFLTKSQRIHLIDSLELRIKSLSKQPQSFTRDTALFRSFQLIFVQSGQLNPNLVKNHRTYSIIFDSLSKISNRINWLEGKADVLFWKAFGLRNVENNESKAFNYFSKAQLLYHQLSLSNKEAWSIIQKATTLVYRHNRTENEWHKATELINQALAIGIKTNDLEIIHQAYNYMGDFHIIRHLYDKALVFYEKEIPYFDKYGAGKELVYLEGRRTNYAYLAICYRQLNNDVKAREYLDKFLKVNNPEDGAYANYLYHTVLSEISNYELNTKKNEKKALKYRLLYENILHERPLFDVANHYFAMFKIYRALKLNGKALEYHEKWVSAKDSLKAEELSKEFRKIETQYNVQRKELEIKILQNTTLLKENEKQQTIRNFLILTSILGFGLIIILVSYNSSRRKNNALQLNLSLVQKEITEKILQTQETERQRIASDLHDDLGGSIATVKRYMAEIKEKNKQNELKKIVDNIEPIIHQTSEDIRRISHNLMPPEFERLGLQNSIQYLVNRSSTPKVQIQFLTFGNVHLLDAEVSINIYRIVSELINNLLKHSRATLATVQMIYYEKYLSVIVEDNGTGHQIVKEPQKGIGLKSIFLRAKYIGATLKVDSGPQGSTYILEIGFK